MIDNNSVEKLKTSVSERLSAKRFSHTLGVMRCAERLSLAVLPEKVFEIKAAALLHDISKELGREESLRILEEHDETLCEEDLMCEGVLHSFTAPIVIMRDFPEYATEDILNATRNHTLGRENMTLFEKIIFLSDYIEDTRVFDSCIRVRSMMFSGFESLTYREKLKRIDECCVAAIDGALEALTRLKRPINSKMYNTKDYLIKNLL